MTTTYDLDRLTAWRVRGTSVLVTQPLIEPVDVGVFILHDRVMDTARDFSILPLYLQTAREFVEAKTRLACLNQTWRYSIDAAPYGNALILPVSPVVSVTSVTSYDVLNAGTVLLNTTYRLDASRPARLVLNDGASWPGGLRATDGLVVDYVAGYGTDPESVPARLRQAIYLLAAELYEHREATTDLDLKDLPFGLRSLIEQLQVYAP